MKRSLRISPWRIRKELVLLYFAFADRRTPFYAKLPAFIGIAYLISPIDIIPDFIPFVGYLDDVFIVPLLLNASIKLLSNDVFESSRVKADRSNHKFTVVFYLIVILIAVLLAGIFILVKKSFQ